MWGLLFDLDGTLALTNGWHEVAWREVLEQHGVSLTAEGYATEISGRSNVEIVGRLLPHLQGPEAAAVWNDKELRFRRGATGLGTLAGLRELVSWAVAQRARLGIVTNAPRANARHILLDLGIADAFDCVIAVEDVVNPKPHAEPYQLAAERLGLSATRCVAFEDSPSGVKAGAAAGMVVIAVRTGHSTEELTAAGATVVVDDFTAPRVRETLERYCS